MINISKEELDDLEIIDSGNFGIIYKKGNKIYKIYKDEIKTDNYSMIKNPLLNNKVLTLNKLNKLIGIRHLIKNTDLIENIIYVDNKLSGVVMPYYDGKTLCDLGNEAFTKRIEYSYKLLNNTKELTNYYIYPTDIRLKNVMVVKDEVKIIDLDDNFTKVKYLKDLILERKTYSMLDNTIKYYLKEYDYRHYERDVFDLINYEANKCNKSYDDIKTYLDYKKIKSNLLFIDEKYNTHLHNVYYFKVILTYKKFNSDYLKHCINVLKDKGVIISDIISEDNIHNYIENTSNNSCLYVKENKVLKLK